MKIWVSYLIDQLSEYSPDWNFDISEKSGPKVSRISTYRTDSSSLRPETFYLCIDCVPNIETRLPPSSYFVVGSDADADHIDNKITLKHAAAQTDLFQKLLDCFDRYQAWLETLIHLSLQKADLQLFLDESEDMLQNPVLIQDPAYSMLAMTKNASSADYPFFDFAGTQRPTPEFLFHIRREMDVFKRYSIGDEGRGVIRVQNGKLELMHNVLYNGNVCANLIFPISRSDYSQGVFDLFQDFCHYLRFALNVSGLQSPSNNIANYAFEQLIQFQNPSALRSYLSPRDDWKFIAGILQLKTEDSLSMNSEYLMQIQDMLPNSVVCFYNNQINLIISVSEKDSDAVYFQYQYQRLQILAEALDGTFGVSYPLPSLSGIPYGLEQSKKALDHPAYLISEEDPVVSQRIKFYRDVATSDILGQFFSDPMFEHYLPPEILGLYRYDVQTGQNNCEILYYYLLTGKSLASTSNALHMHRSTIVYRLERMKENFNLHFDYPEQNLLYLLCCMSCKLRMKYQRHNPNYESLLK